MSQRLPRLVNALSDVDFRAILGDNFYDRDGDITQRFFDKLTLKAKSQWQMTVPGNHDFWNTGLLVCLFFFSSWWKLHSNRT